MDNALQRTVNVTDLLDEGPMGWLMIRVGLICAGVALLDGSDTTSIGVARHS